MFQGNLREEQFAAAIEESKGKYIMAAGCFEMHGQYLPVSTDVLTADYIVQEEAKIEPVCVFLASKFGDVQGIQEQTGTVDVT